MTSNYTSRAESDSNGIRELLHSSLDGAPGVLVEGNLLAARPNNKSPLTLARSPNALLARSAEDGRG